MFSRTESGSNSPSRVAVARQVDDPARFAPARARQRAPARPRSGTSPCARLQAGERAEELALPVALDAGEADDLARPRRRGSTSWKRGAAEPVDARAAARRLGRAARLVGEDLLDRAADDQAQDLVLGDAGGRERAARLAVAQHGDPVGDRACTSGRRCEM